MYVYLFEKEKCTTYAVIAKNEDEASEKFVGRLNPPYIGARAPYQPKYPSASGYTVKRFIDGQDGDIFNLLKDGIEISYSGNLGQSYIVHKYFPTKLI